MAEQRKLKIVYKLDDMKINDEMESDLRALLKKHGWGWYGQGTDYPTGMRDIAFSKG